MYQHGGNIYSHNDMLDFSTNINLLGIPSGVVIAAKEGVDRSYQYPDPNCSNLRQEISNHEKISKEHIICGNGAAELIFSLVLAIRPQKALLPVPSFYEYDQALKIVDCEMIPYYLKEEEGFLLQKDFLEAITAQVDMVILCNPNNPTGALINPGLMEEILCRCEKQQVLLLMDECFMDFIDESERNTIKEKCQTLNYLFVLKAFTKLYAMPGIRLGYGLCRNIALLKSMKEVVQPWGVSLPAQMAGVAALREKEYVKKTKKLLQLERIYLLEKLQTLGMKTYGSSANYIFFKGEEGLHKKCYEKGILIRDCSNYKGLGEGYYRVAVRNHEDNQKLIRVIERV
jgi:threonine-phosphate decarboxylase